MSAVLSPPLPPPPTFTPQPRKWTRAEYYRLADLGFFQGQRAELIGGEIMVMSPQNWPHTNSTLRTAKALDLAFAAVAWVRYQVPLMLGLSSDPEPDVSVVPGRQEDFTNHPTTALLVAEISDTTLAFDRGRKAGLYAAANIPEYWIVNLNDHQVEVFRDPQPDAAQPFGARYMQVTIHRAGATIAPLALPQNLIAVADLLP